MDFNNPKPTGNGKFDTLTLRKRDFSHIKNRLFSDYIVKFDKSIRQAMGHTNVGVPFTTHILPSRRAMMHRIRPDNEGNIWFTEMATDKIGKITLLK